MLDTQVRSAMYVVDVALVITVIAASSIGAQNPTQKLPNTEHLMPSLDGEHCIARIPRCVMEKLLRPWPDDPILKAKVPI